MKEQNSIKYTRRKTAVPTKEYMETIIKPLMEQVAKKNIKKNIALSIAAVAGGINFLPYQLDYTGNSNPIQTLSSYVTLYKFQPKNMANNNENLEDISIPVFPMMNKKYNVPNKVIERFTNLCNKYNIDSTIFTTTGGEIKLTNNFIKTIVYFCSDKGLNKHDEIWGAIKPIKNVPIELLENEDRPYSKR